VQSVERDSLTEGYKNKFQLFHKLFLSGVENLGSEFLQRHKKAAY
jgi:hypothetical protein